MQAFIQSRYAPDSYSYPTLEELVLDGCKLKSISSDDFQFLSTFQNLVSLSVTCTGKVKAFESNVTFSLTQFS